MLRDLKNILGSFDRWFVLTSLLSILVRQIWLFSVIERDEGGLALVSLQWINGFLPYVYSYNNAGPLGYVIYAASTLSFGTSFVPVRLINNLLFFLSIIPIYSCVRSWFNRNVALVASLFYGIFMSAPIYEGQLALTSSLAAPLVVFSIFFCSKYIQNKSWKALLISAFLLSTATLIKVLVIPALLLLLGTVALSHFRNGPRSSHPKQLQRDALVAVFGFSILPIIFVIYFGWMGAMNNVFNVFINMSLLGHQTMPDVPFGIYFNVVVQGLPLWIFALLGLIVFLFKRNKFDLLLIGWLIVAALIAVFPPHFGHRYVFLIAPASILAGLGVVTAINSLRFALSDSHINAKVRGRSAISFFIIALLVLSPSVAFVFQSRQFPQYDLDSKWLNFQWVYADSASYSTQTRLGEFLRSNCSTQGSILVHGWSAEIYYLANKLPTSEYVWSVRDPRWLDIPENEYDKFVENIKNHVYELVVFFDHDVNALEQRRGDPVVNETLSGYVYYGNIDNALIFGKSNHTG